VSRHGMTRSLPCIIALSLFAVTIRAADPESDFDGAAEFDVAAPEEFDDIDVPEVMGLEYAPSSVSAGGGMTIRFDSLRQSTLNPQSSTLNPEPQTRKPES